MAGQLGNHPGVVAAFRVAALGWLAFAAPAHAQSTGVPAPVVRQDPPVNALEPLAATPRAEAPPPGLVLVPVPPPPAAREYENWYGWQTLTTDGASLLFLVAYAVAADQRRDGMATAFAVATVGSYVAGGPIVHAAHDNWGRAMGSLGLRVGAPIVGGLVGAALEGCSGGDFCGIQGGALGATLGLVTAIAVDAAVLARETVSEEPVMMPSVSTGKNGSWVGLTGRF